MNLSESRSRLAIITALCAVSAGLSSVPAHAEVSELRLGVSIHDAGIFGNRKENGADVNAEALFSSPSMLAVLASPRPHVGTNVNTQGDSSQIYAGLTWTWDVWSGFFVDASFGGAAHNGYLSFNGDDRQDRKELGLRVLFRESLSVGYRLDERNSLSLMLDHISNANLGRHNEGLDTLGMRWGYRF